MNDPIILIGIGEIGGVLARGFLRTGHPVYPILRDTDLELASHQTPNPALAIVAVGEQALYPVLEHLPPQWRQHCLLLQNELLPADWLRHKITSPTVMTVWFEKKPGQDVKQIVPTPVFGPEAPLVINALAAVGIDTVHLTSAESLLFELIRKNLYILTTNLCGLEVGGNVETLVRDHGALVHAVASEVLDLQQALTEQPLDREALMLAMYTAFAGDPAHRCQGRSAADRLRRAIDLGNGFGLNLPKLRELAARHLN